ncbi:MAG: 1-(5-phosphoribosyl)-5-[(5-phosphoribosylamino)methylideneamino]imidazole-4-carboxamide isomerase [Pseudobacteriovorax sp.]|nr:1-(5-phosphoribosyl)-5-[(5-phosphoribosylamino)methylideneamino]imidazole-4-carboxamide isomerase [Pseudobacteriovorax sp.]
MKIYPAIDLIQGEVVRLTKGDFKQKTKYHANPLEMARSFSADGASYLHIVDLDGAKAGKPQQTDLIKSICQETPLKIQVGGGIRSAEHVQELIDAGIDRVIIGSLAVKDKQLTKRIFETFSGDRITLGLDILLSDEGVPMVATHGWQEVSNIAAKDLLEEYISVGLNQVLCTDIDKDGMLEGPNFDLYRDLSQSFPDLTILASGGVSNLEQLKKLKQDNVGGAIIGKALYENKISLSEACDVK